MMTILSQRTGRKRIISKIEGNDLIRNKIQDMGIIVGNEIEILSSLGDSIIVLVKGTKIALSKEVASRIRVDFCEHFRKGDKEHDNIGQGHYQHRRGRIINHR
jgi:ferrous iron transport protein A